VPPISSWRGRNNPVCAKVDGGWLPPEAVATLVPVKVIEHEQPLKGSFQSDDDQLFMSRHSTEHTLVFAHGTQSGLFNRPAVYFLLQSRHMAVLCTTIQGQGVYAHASSLHQLITYCMYIREHCVRFPACFSFLPRFVTVLFIGPSRAKVSVV
jgi:hypothetical protein